MNKIDQIKNISKTYFENPMAGHDWSHVERVYNLSEKIARSENADLDIVRISALLHDIARKKEDLCEVECHANEGSKMAQEILSKLKFDPIIIQKVSHAISCHRYKKKIKPDTLEAKILQDADRLDALGAVCIGRIFTFGGEKKRPMYDPKLPPRSFYDGNGATSLNHFFEKIFYLKPSEFNTKTAKEIAKKRYSFTKLFVKRFLDEWEGKI